MRSWSPPGQSARIPLKIEGLDGDGRAVSGYDFMKRYNRGDPIPVSGDVVIIGGGFTAVDCARAARRLLSEKHRVTAIMYRRGEEHMSASPEEIWQLRLEGIEVGTLVNPARVRSENGRVKAVVFDRNVLGDEAEGGGKPPIHRVPGSDYEVPCDTLIYAVGQTRTLEILPEGVEIGGGNQTTHAKIFVSGDFHTGPLDVIHAVADAKQAATAIDEFLMGRKRCAAGYASSRPTTRAACAITTSTPPPTCAPCRWTSATATKRSKSATTPVKSKSTPAAATSATSSSKSTRTSASTATGASRHRRVPASTP